MTRRQKTPVSTSESEELAPAGSKSGRVRIALAAVLVVLFLLLIVIVGFVMNLLAPAGSTGEADIPAGVTWVRSIYGASAAAEDQFESPVQTAIGPDGTIWVTDFTKNRVLGFAPDGSFRRELTAVSAEGEAEMLKWPAGIAVDENGDVYVASTGTDAVIVWDDGGEIARVIPVPDPIQVAVRDGRLFVTATGGLFLFSTGGEQIATWSSRGSGADQVDIPYGAVMGADGTLYLSDTQNGQIKALSADGTEVLWATPEVSRRAGLAAPGTEAPADPTEGEDTAESSPDPSEETSVGADSAAYAATMQIPSGMTMDAAGRLVYVDPFAFAIYTADAETGEITSMYESQGEADGEFNYPLGISYDTDRDWFAITDTANARVQIVRIEGSGGSALTTLRGLSFPWGACAAPLVLLLIALAVALSRRRRSGEIDDPGAAPEREEETKE